MTSQSGKVKMAGVVGWPVEQSRSPLIHNYWLKKYGIDGSYVAIPVEPDEFTDSIVKLRSQGFRGVNVTLPHKQATVALADDLDEAARQTGAVNTLIFHDNGRLEGRNTDPFGFMQNLHQQVPDWQVPETTAIVLGAGGAARGIVWGLREAGVTDIKIVNRTVARANDLAAHFGGSVRAIAWESMDLKSCDLLVNSTSLGMQGQPPLIIDLENLPAKAVVADIVYTPLETRLLAAARARGNRTVDGLGMLLHQARPGFAAWFGPLPDGLPEIDDALWARLRADIC